MSYRTWARSPVLLVPVLSIACFAPSLAQAGGFELTPAGARANGRAGAEFAGGDSAMSLFYNP